MNQIFTSNQSVPLIYNRDGVGNDGWMHIVPTGELPNKTAGVVQVLDRKAHEAIVANLRADEQRLGNRWPGLYMGEEHFIYNDDKSSEAFVWAKEFKIEPDGVWARGEQTDVGAPALKNKRFKYTSFVCDPNQPGAIEKLPGNKVRVLKLDTVGFTNNANGKALLSPIINRKNFPPGNQAGADDQQHSRYQPGATKTRSMKTVCTLLGLSPEAAEEAVHSETIKIINRAKTAEEALAPMKNRAETAEAKIKDLEGTVVEATLDKYANRFPKEKRDTWKKTILANRADAVELLESLPVIGGKTQEQARLHNRAAAKTPDAAGADQSVDEGMTVQQLSGEVRKLMNRDGLKNFNEAYQKLMQEKPELFESK